jgi:hypothetical protein
MVRERKKPIECAESRQRHVDFQMNPPAMTFEETAKVARLMVICQFPGYEVFEN